jgi:hypothetical protein
VDNPRVSRNLPLMHVVAACCLLATAVAGCGSNPCQERDERVAECLGAEPNDENEFPDEQCVDAIEAEAECLLDQSCDALNAGDAYVTCAQGG